LFDRQENHQLASRPTKGRRHRDNREASHVTLPDSRRRRRRVEAPEGFQAGQPTIAIGKIEDIPVNSYTWMAHEVTVHFTLHALQGAPSGEQVVPGTLTYSSLDEKGNTSSHTAALSFPVHVVPPPKPGYWDQHPQARKAWVTTGEVLLVIIALPVWIVGNILGFYRWDC